MKHIWIQEANTSEHLTTLVVTTDAISSRNGLLGSFLRSWISFLEVKKEIVPVVPLQPGLGMYLRARGHFIFSLPWKLLPLLSVSSCLENLNFTKSYEHRIALIKEK